MANPDHLAALQKGIRSWNLWRDANPGIVPDISGSDLSNANLGWTFTDRLQLTRSYRTVLFPSHAIDFGFADLTDARLVSANLNGANLRWAQLARANLSGASLIGASLEGADLRDATLVEADLRESNLEGSSFVNAILVDASLMRANLRGTDFSSADLTRANLDGIFGRLTRFDGADLTHAILAYSTLVGVTVRDTKGLGTIQHAAPSSVGIDTILQSAASLPDTFLRNIGAPDEIINLVHRIAAGQLGYYSCFISHSAKDSPFATRLHDDLRAHAVLCWFASEDLPGMICNKGASPPWT